MHKLLQQYPAQDLYDFPGLALDETTRQNFHADIFYGIFIAMEGISGYARHLADFGGIPKLFGQIQQTSLVFNDSFVTIECEGRL